MSKFKFSHLVTLALLFGVVRGVIALVDYGGSKAVVDNWGADEGLNVCWVTAVYDTTNDCTTVGVGFTGTNVTIDTSVSVRNWDTNPWTALDKIEPEISYDMATNVLLFAVAGNERGRRQWWVGVDTPAVIIETEGILIHQFEARSKYVMLSWSCDDPRAEAFEVQYRVRGETAWRTMGTTAELYYIHYGFTVGVNSEWRVISRIGGW